MNMRSSFSLAILSICVSTPAATSASRLDTEYPVQPPSGPIYWIVASPDGRSHAAGAFSYIGSISNILGVAELSHDGNVTLPFLTVHPALGTRGSIWCGSLSKSRELFVGGDFDRIGVRTLHGLAAFSPEGVVRTDFEPQWLPAESDVHCIVQLQDDFIIGGTFVDATSQIRSLAKVDRYGALDASFKVQIGSDGEDEAQVRSILLTDQGKLVVAGQFSSINGSNATNLAILSLNGAIDPGPILELAPDREVLALASDAKGRIYVGGAFSSLGGDERFSGIARLLPNGSLDRSFFLHEASGDFEFSGQVQAIAVQEDGRVIVGGFFDIGTTNVISNIARFRDDGAVDRTFSSTGPQAGPDGPVTCLALEADTSVLIGGEFLNVDGVHRPYLARLRGDSNSLPSVQIKSPLPFAQVRHNQSLTVNVEASDQDDAIAQVELLDALTGARLGVLNQAPFQWTLTNTWAGILFLQAKVVDVRGASALSVRVPIVEQIAGFLDISVFSKVLHLTLSGASGWLYELQRLSDLGESAWQPLGRILMNNTNTAQWELPLESGPQKYYRAVPIE